MSNTSYMLYKYKQGAEVIHGVPVEWKIVAEEEVQAELELGWSNTPTLAGKRHDDQEKAKSAQPDPAKKDGKAS